MSLCRSEGRAWHRHPLRGQAGAEGCRRGPEVMEGDGVERSAADMVGNWGGVIGSGHSSPCPRLALALLAFSAASRPARRCEEGG